MLDVVCFVLMCAPIVTGLFFVMHSLKERSRAAAAPRVASNPTPQGPAPRHFSVLQTAKRP